MSNLGELAVFVKTCIKCFKIETLGRLHKIVSVSINLLNIIATERVGDFLSGDNSGAVIKQGKIFVDKLARNHRTNGIANNEFLAIEC